VKEIASDHGIKYPTHQSLSNPPLKYAELFERLYPEPKTPPLRSSRHYTNKTSKEPKEEAADSVDLILNSKFGLTASAIQRALGRWSKTITLFTRVFITNI
jgi:hypothetical protein